MRSGSLSGCLLTLLLLSGPPGTHQNSHGAVSGPSPGTGPEVRFSVDQKALLDLARAATPYTITIGNNLISADLVFMEPSGLVLTDGMATMRIRVKGRKLPVDQVLRPILTIEYDSAAKKYFAVISSLLVQIPGLGRVDLRDALPRVEIPAVLENLWEIQDRPVGLKLRLRSVVIREARIEIEADIDFAPAPSAHRSESAPTHFRRLAYRVSPRSAAAMRSAVSPRP